MISNLDARKQKKRRKEEEAEEFNPDDDGEGGELEMVPGCAARNAEQEDEKALEDEYGAKDYRPQMQLKSDYNSRPLWVVRIQLESCSRNRELISNWCRPQMDTFSWSPSPLCTDMLTTS
jgi:hypothetical protein